MTTARWRVVRMDDNGNIYVVEEDLDERAARRRALELEARAHKQMYWAEPTGAPPRSG